MSNFESLPVLILAGGFGSRLSEKTNLIPKPMVKVGEKPIIACILDIFIKQGLKNFYILGGYKVEVISNYFRSWCGEIDLLKISNSNKNQFHISEEKVIKSKFNDSYKDVSISVVNTGLETLTGGRIGRILPILSQKKFIVTYGDGLSNVNIKSLILKHEKSKSEATITIVNPSSRYGRVKIDKDRIIDFQEKPVFEDNWVNAGFMVFNKDYLRTEWFNDQTILEEDILKIISERGELGYYKHEGFWKCMDNLRDYKELNKIASKNDLPPWEDF